MESEKQEYEDLTGKYEILEEEHVVTKAKLVMEKETLNKYACRPAIGSILKCIFSILVNSCQLNARLIQLKVSCRH